MNRNVLTAVVVGMQYYHTSCIFLTLSNRHWQAASDYELARSQRIVEVRLYKYWERPLLTG
jgi:hypothetical protein